MMSLDEIWETSMYVRCRLIGSIENGKGGYPENDIQCLLLNGLIIINVSTRAFEAYSPILMHVWFFPLLFLMLPVLCLLIFLWWRFCETLPFRSSSMTNKNICHLNTSDCRRTTAIKSKKKKIGNIDYSNISAWINQLIGWQANHCQVSKDNVNTMI